MRTKIKVFFSLFILLGMMLSSSCVKDDFDEPEVISPEDVTSGLTPNITVQGIRDMYDSLTVVDGNVKTFTTDLVLEAKVISTDKSGNFYKEMYVEDATGGLVLSIDGSSLFNDFNLGQTVHIKLKGLNINYDLSFKAIVEIGFGLFDDDGEMKLGRIPVSILKDYVFKNGAPSTPTTTTITLDNNSLTDENVGKFVKIENTQFIDSDTNATYADAVGQTSQSLNLESCSGSTQLALRSSGYALFAGINVPTGNGNITGVLTKYGTQGYQLIINTNNDVEFTGTRCGGGGGGSGSGAGSGTFDDPYDVEAAISNNNSATGVWVNGFIVGAYESGTPSNYVSLTAPFTTIYNLFIANSATETDSTKMVNVQLTVGEIRDVTNLANNGTLLGSEIMYHGDLLTYNTFPGIKNTNGYWLNGSGIDPDYVDPNTIWNINFTSGLGNFTVVDLEGAQTWESDSQYGAVMSGYDGTNNNANQDWLVSETIDLTGKTGVKFNLNQAVNYLDTWNNIKIYATDNYTGDVTTTTWTEIVVTTKPTGSDWNFVQSEDVDFSAYDNSSSVVIAFELISTATASATWEIKTVTLKQ